MGISVPLMEQLEAKIRRTLDGMNAPRIPQDWLHMKPGDRIATTSPLHRITAIIEAVRTLGFDFETEPSPRGYWVICIRSPDRVIA